MTKRTKNNWPFRRPSKINFVRSGIRFNLEEDEIMSNFMDNNDFCERLYTEQNISDNVGYIMVGSEFLCSMKDI